MRIIRIVLLILIYAVSNNNVQAQNVSQVYILTLEEDNIKGFIIDQTDAELGLKIEFKKELTNTI